jgi:hypothetical protein
MERLVAIKTVAVFAHPLFAGVSRAAGTVNYWVLAFGRPTRNWGRNPLVAFDERAQHRPWTEAPPRITANAKRSILECIEFGRDGE